MLSDEEKQELRDMAASETLRIEFRVLRNNSRAIEQRLSVDDLARWLTAINRICPGDPRLRQ
jgi:hypothetical protein